MVTTCSNCGPVTRGHAVVFHCEQNVISAATWYSIYHYATVYVVSQETQTVTKRFEQNLFKTYICEL